MISKKLFIPHPNRLVTDLLKLLLCHRRYNQFQRVHEELGQAVPDRTCIRNTYVQYLLSAGRRTDALGPAEELPISPGLLVGYMFYGLVQLELGNPPDVVVNLNCAQNWLIDPPALKRLRLD